METTEQNLWPADLSELRTQSVRTPVGILREQARNLATVTGNLVRAEIISDSADDGRLVHVFRLLVRELGNYRFDLFYILHGAALYPVTVVPSDDSNAIECTDEDAYVKALREVFSLEATRNVLKSLAAQALDLNKS